MPPPAHRTPLSVSDFTARIKGLLEPAFTDVWIAGEISQFNRAASGHIYLSLKDSESSLKSVIWRSTAYRLKFDAKLGMEVIAHGKIDLYAPNGEYKFVIDILEPKGVGAAELALRQLKEKLLKQGFRAFSDLRNEKISYKIREHSLQKLPYQLVVGDKEMQAGTVAVRTRSGEDLGAMPLEAFVGRLQSEAQAR